MIVLNSFVILVSPLLNDQENYLKSDHDIFVLHLYPINFFSNNFVRIKFSLQSLRSNIAIIPVAGINASVHTDQETKLLVSRRGQTMWGWGVWGPGGGRYQSGGLDPRLYIYFLSPTERRTDICVCVFPVDFSMLHRQSIHRNGHTNYCRER
jgi:hypothetical protein